MKTKLTLATMAIAAGSAAHAQSLPQGYYTEGDIVYEYYFDNDGNDVSGLVFDFTLGLSPGSIGSAPIGAEVYLSYINFDQGSLDALAYGGLIYYESSFGRFGIGTPRSTIGDYVDTMSFGKVLDNTEFGIYVDGLTDLYIKTGEYANYGARYDGSFGAFSVGASYHYFPDEDDSTFTLAGRYEVNNYAFAIGYEGVGDTGLLFASASAEYGAFEAGLTLTSFTDTDSLVYGAQASYDITPDLEVGLSYINFDGGDSIAKLNVEYAFFDNAYVGASYYDNLFGSDGAYSLYAGYSLDF